CPGSAAIAGVDRQAGTSAAGVSGDQRNTPLAVKINALPSDRATMPSGCGASLPTLGEVVPASCQPCECGSHNHAHGEDCPWTGCSQVPPATSTAPEASRTAAWPYSPTGSSAPSIHAPLRGSH